MNDNAYRYDAYVSHAAADRNWVEDELVPRLEAAGRRLCLDDDLVPGRVELDERSRAVAASRRTLLILSPAYRQSAWPVLEGALAQHLDPAGRKRRLIPVLVGEAELPLRIRPLVAVDLRRGDEQQWQRLLDATDPEGDESSDDAGPLQRLSLQLAEATGGLARPRWHGAGTLLLAVALLAWTAAVSLVQLLLWEVASLRLTATLLLTLPPLVVAALAWREDRDVFKRLSHLAGRSFALRGAIVVLTLVVAGGWVWAGLPSAFEAYCGPVGCPEEGEIRLVLKEFELLTPTTTDSPGSWTVGTRKALEMKLGLAGVRVLGQGVAAAPASASWWRYVDYAVEGQFERWQRPVLTAQLYAKGQVLEPPEIRVEGSSEAAAGRRSADDGEEVLELRNRLADAVLARLGLTPAPAVAERIARLPTAVAEAERLNNDAMHLAQERRFEDAEGKLRAALLLDPEYSVALANLADVERSVGRYGEAEEHLIEAVELVPTYAPFVYNLGNLYAALGRLEEAREWLRKAAEIDPAHVPTYNEIGRVELERGRTAAAIQAFTAGRQIDPGFAPLSKNLGRALLAAGRLEEAADAVGAALGLYRPDQLLDRLEAHALLVQIHARRRGGTTEACRHLAMLRALDPAGVSPWSAEAETAARPLGCQGSPPPLGLPSSAGETAWRNDTDPREEGPLNVGWPIAPAACCAGAGSQFAAVAASGPTDPEEVASC